MTASNFRTYKYRKEDFTFDPLSEIKELKAINHFSIASYIRNFATSPQTHAEVECRQVVNKCKLLLMHSRLTKLRTQIQFSLDLII